MRGDESADAIGRREALRSSMRARCDALEPAVVERWGGSIEARALELVQQRCPLGVFLYLSIPGEAPTGSLARRLIAQGTVVAAPRLRRGSNKMQLRRVNDLDADTFRGLWDIPIPKKTCPVVDPKDIDVAIVPATAVDAAGYRLGRGGGCYDRFLGENPHVYAAGVTYEMQRVEDCWPQPWDVPLDALITEDGVYTFPRVSVGSV